MATQQSERSSSTGFVSARWVIPTLALSIGVALAACADRSEDKASTLASTQASIEVGAGVDIGDPLRAPSGRPVGIVMASPLPNGSTLAVMGDYYQLNDYVVQVLDQDGAPAGPPNWLGARNELSELIAVECGETECLLLVTGSGVVGVWLGLDGVRKPLLAFQIDASSERSAEIEFGEGAYHIVLDGFQETEFRTVTPTQEISVSAPAVSAGCRASSLVLQAGVVRHLAVLDAGLPLGLCSGVRFGAPDGSGPEVVLSGPLRTATASTFGTDVLLAWLDDTGQLWAQWYDSALQPLGSNFFVADGANAFDVSSASGNRGVALGWHDGYDSHAAVVLPGGMVDPTYDFIGSWPIRLSREVAVYSEQLGQGRAIAWSQSLQANGAQVPNVVSIAEREQSDLAFIGGDQDDALAIYTEMGLYDGLVEPISADITRRLMGHRIQQGVPVGTPFQLGFPTPGGEPPHVLRAPDGWVLIESDTNTNTNSLELTRTFIPSDPAMIPVALPLETIGELAYLRFAWSHFGQEVLATASANNGQGPYDYRIGGIVVNGSNVAPLAATEADAGRSLVIGQEQSRIVGWWFDGTSTSLPFEISDYAGDFDKRDLSVAWNDGQALVVWQETRLGDQGIFGARVTADGTVLDQDAIQISTQTLVSKSVVTATKEGQFVVAWLRESAAGTHRVLTAHVSGGGTVLDPNAVAVASEFSATEVKLVTPAQGSPLLVTVESRQPFTAGRASVRAIDAGDPLLSACATADTCASRICMDQVCCAEKCGECERCGSDGTCEPVTNDSDDSCFGNEACNDQGICLPATGEACTDAVSCASGHCVDGFCCDRSCDSGCERCDQIPGVCSPLDCGSYQCEESRVCLQACVDSSQCAPGHQCTAGGDCVAVQSTEAPSEGDGCGCRVVGPPARGIQWPALLVATLLALRRRKTNQSR